MKHIFHITILLLLANLFGLAWGAQACNPCAHSSSLVPLDQTVYVGKNAKFEVQVNAPTHAGPFKYGWTYAGGDLVAGGGANDASLTLTSKEPLAIACGIACAINLGVCSKCNQVHDEFAGPGSVTWEPCPAKIKSLKLVTVPVDRVATLAPPVEEIVSAIAECEKITPDDLDYDWSVVMNSGRNLSGEAVPGDKKKYKVKHNGEIGATGDIECTVSCKKCPICEQGHLGSLTENGDITIECAAINVTIEPKPVKFQSGTNGSATATVRHGSTETDANVTYEWKATMPGATCTNSRTTSISYNEDTGGIGSISCKATITGCKNCKRNHGPESDNAGLHIKCKDLQFKKITPDPVAVVRNDSTIVTAEVTQGQSATPCILTCDWSTTIGHIYKDGENANSATFVGDDTKNNGQITCKARVDSCAYCGESHPEVSKSVDASIITVSSVTWLDYGKMEITTANNHPKYPVGLMHDPGASTPAGSANNQIYARVRVSEKKSVKIRFKMIDPDDPDSDFVIDPNGQSGWDNHGQFGYGYGFSVNYDGIGEAITNDDGYVDITILTPMAPGDNLKMLATTAGEKYDDLRSCSDTQVRPDDSTQYRIGSTDIISSRMITIWRTLNVEIDSMDKEAVYNPFNPLSGPPVFVKSPDIFDDYSGFSMIENNVPQLGQCTLTCKRGLGGQTSQYEGGWLTIYHGGTRLVYDVIDNNSPYFSANTIIISGTLNDQLKDGILNDGSPFRIQDDDPYVCQLPSFRGVPQLAVSAYSKAYICPREIEDGFNSRKIVANKFSLSRSDVGSANGWADTRDVTGNNNYWAAHVVMCYQPYSDSDFDPDNVYPRNSGETFVTGVKPSGHPSVAIFIETLRECDEFRRLGGSAPNDYEHTFSHELGHFAGGENGHSEGGLMTGDGNPLTDYSDFTELTIARFRATSAW